jgi:hypothetical protein
MRGIEELREYFYVVAEIAGEKETKIMEKFEFQSHFLVCLATLLEHVLESWNYEF